MARAPDDRYASATELKQAITDYLRHREALAFFAQAQNRLVQLEQVVAQQHVGLEGSALGLTAHAAFSECRFGFEQVRRIWPEFDGARQGMQKALLLMAQHEVHHDDARAARILIAQLEQPPPELLAAVEAIEAQQRERAARLDQLERDARDRELDVVLEAKRSFSFSFGALVLAGGVAATVLIEKGLVVPKTGFGVLVFLVPVLSTALFSVQVRKDRERNDAQRRLVGGLRLNAWATIAIWSAAWALDVPPTTALTFHLLAIASNWIMGAILFYRRGALIGIPMAVAALASVLVPRFAFLTAGICGFIGFTLMGLTQPRRRTRG